MQAGGCLELLNALFRHEDLLRGLTVDVAGAGLVPPDDVLAGKLGDPDLLALGAFAQDGHAHLQNSVTGHDDLPDVGLTATFLRRLGHETGGDLAALADFDSAGGIADGLPSQSRAGHRGQKKGGGQGKEGGSARGKHNDSSIAPAPARVKRRCGIGPIGVCAGPPLWAAEGQTYSPSRPLSAASRRCFLISCSRSSQSRRSACILAPSPLSAASRASGIAASNHPSISW